MTTLLAAAAAGALVIAAQAQVGETPATGQPYTAPRPMGDWTTPLGDPRPSLSSPPALEETIDVVDAHWMALTMWGEARSQGEDGMRAVGHVILNRRDKAGDSAFVTDTVSEAWQFSCWNAGDPNRALMLNIDLLAEDSEDYRLWRAARRIADDILAGRSADPTGGALFYHTMAVSPAWSRGVSPVRRVGDHLFFRTAR